MAGEIELLTERVLTHVIGHDVSGLAGRFDVKSHFTYQSAEYLMGETWIDGRPVYRRVVDCSALANGAAIMTLASLNGQIIGETGRARDIVTSYSAPITDGVNYFRTHHTIATGAITLHRAGAFGLPKTEEFLILEYVK